MKIELDKVFFSPRGVKCLSRNLIYSNSQLISLRDFGIMPLFVFTVIIKKTINASFLFLHFFSDNKIRCGAFIPRTKWIHKVARLIFKLVAVTAIFATVLLRLYLIWKTWQKDIHLKSTLSVCKHLPIRPNFFPPFKLLDLCKCGVSHRNPSTDKMSTSIKVNALTVWVSENKQPGLDSSQLFHVLASSARLLNFTGVVQCCPVYTAAGAASCPSLLSHFATIAAARSSSFCRCKQIIRSPRKSLCSFHALPIVRNRNRANSSKLLGGSQMRVCCCLLQTNTWMFIIQINPHFGFRKHHKTGIQ